MTFKHKSIHFLSLLAILVNMLVPLGAPLVTAQDDPVIDQPAVAYDAPEGEGDDSSIDDGSILSSSQIADQDSDGIADEADNCVADSNENQSDIDGDGVGDACDPVNDLDRDGDGVYNDVDNCPDAANADQADIDGDGIGDPCDAVNDSDRDGDGVRVDVDICPDASPVIDADGDGCEDVVAPVDTDGDGVNDDLDVCPDVAPVVDADGDGCEDVVVPVDSDGDGVNDDLDVCLDVAPVMDADGDGCEDVVAPVDTDGDGLNNDLDLCPDVAAVNDADGDGCEDDKKPEEAVKPVEKPVVSPDKIDGDAKKNDDVSTQGMETQSRTKKVNANSLTVKSSDATCPDASGSIKVTWGDGISKVKIGKGTTPNNASGWQEVPNGTATSILESGTYFVLVTKSGSYDWGNDWHNGDAWQWGSGTNDNQKYQIKTVTISPCAPDVKVEKTANRSQYVGGETITWTLKVTNIGTGNATSVQLKDDLPIVAGVTWDLSSLPAGCTLGAGTETFIPITCSIPTLGSGSGNAWVWTVTAKVSAIPMCATIPNTATVSASNESHGKQGNNSATKTVTVKCENDKKVAFCHDNNSVNNHYNYINTSVNGWYNGHYTQDDGTGSAELNDIWPAVTYNNTTYPAHGNQAWLPDCLMPVPDLPELHLAHCEDGVYTPPSVSFLNGAGKSEFTFSESWSDDGLTVTVTATLSNSAKYDVPNPLTDGWGEWNRENADSISWTHTFEDGGCATTAPSIDANPYVCVDNTPDRSRDNTFTVDPGTGFTLQSVKVNDQDREPTDGKYQLPPSGTYTVIVEVKLGEGVALPQGLEPNEAGNYEYTFTGNVIPCIATFALEPPTPSVCRLGVAEMPGMLAPTVQSGVTYGEVQETILADGSYVFSFTATVAVGNTVPDPLPELKYGAWSLDLANPTTTAVFTSIPLQVVDCSAHVSLTKTGNGSVVAGQNAIFTIEVENKSENNEAMNVGLTDDLPDGYVWTLSGTDADACTELVDGTGTLSCDFGTLAPGAMRTVTLKALTDPHLCTTIDNVAEITSTNGGTNTANNSSEDTVIVTCTATVWPGMSTTISECREGVASDPGMSLGMVSGFSYVVTSNGTAITGTDYPNASAPYTYYELTGASPYSIQVTLTLRDEYSWPPAGSQFETMWQIDGNTAQRKNPVTVSRAECNPDVGITKAGPVSVDPGQPVQYTLTVTNTGNVTLPIVTVTDLLSSDITGWTVTSSTPSACIVFPGVPPIVVVPGFPPIPDVQPSLICNFFVMAPDDVQTITITGTAPTAPSTAVCDNGFNNVAWASGIVSDQSESIHTDLNCAPDVSYEKTGPATSVTPGNDIVFTIEVKNTGTHYAADVMVFDALPAELAGLTWNYEISGNHTGGSCAWTSSTLNCSGITLPAYSGNYMITLTAETNAEAPVCGTYINQAGPTQGSRSDIVRDDVTIDCVPDFDVEKESAISDTDANGELSLGDTVTYTVAIWNDGNVVLSGLTLDDVFSGSEDLDWIAPDGFDGGIIPDIAVGGDLDLVATYVVTQADVDAGTIENCATVTLPGTQLSDDFCVDDDLPDDPSILVEKTDTILQNVVAPDDRIDAGDEIEYTITVTNTGNVTLTNVLVTDPLVGFSETIESLAPGVENQVEFTVTYVVTLADLNAGEIENCADATGNPPSGEELPVPQFMAMKSEGDDEEPYAYDDVCINTDLENEPGIVIVKDYAVLMNTVAPDDRVDVGDTIEYTFVVTNTGNVTLENVIVNDPLVGLNETIPSLIPGASESLTATYVVTLADLDLGNVENCADVSGQPPLQEIVENRALIFLTDAEPMETTVADDTCIDTPLDPAPAVDFEKTGALSLGDDESLNAGDQITYEFVVTNTGNVTLVDLVVEDPMEGLTWDGESTIASLAPGASATMSATYAVTQADVDAGVVENCATAMNDVASDEDCFDTPLTPVPAIQLVKSATAATGDDDELNVNEVITYTFAVTNIGNATLTDLTVVDPMVGITWIDGNTIAALAPGETVELTATYAVTQANVDSGILTNCADVTGNAGETPVMDDDCVTTPLDQNISLLAVQECPGPTANFQPGVGDDVNVEVTITNDGDVTVTNIVVEVSREGTFSEPFPTELAPGQSATRIFTFQVTEEDYEIREATIVVDVTGTRADGTSAKLASMAAMQDVGDSATNTITSICPLGDLPVSTPKPASVAGLPDTGSGPVSIVAGSSIIWAATVAMVALGLGAFGFRRLEDR